ncbi:hypothetical protein GCM10010837_51520 [Aminobacter niigataensis]
MFSSIQMRDQIVTLGFTIIQPIKVSKLESLILAQNERWRQA